MDKQLLIQNLTFSYNSEDLVYDDFSLAIKHNEITAVLGHNGAGKTTLFKLICNLLSPRSGKIISDYNTVSLVLGNLQLYADLSCFDNMMLFKKMYKSKITNVEIEAILNKFSLSKDKMVSELSNGMKQRLNIAKSLVIDSELVILDEPTSGLDPVNKQDIINILKDYKDDNKTILISSHDMDEVLELADNVIYIKKGKVLLNTDLKSLKGVLENEVLIYQTKPLDISEIELFETRSNNVKTYYTIYNKDYKYSGEFTKRMLHLKDIYILLENELYDKFIAKIKI